MTRIERLQEVALFNKAPQLEGVLTKGPSFDLKCVLGSILMILGTHLTRNHVLRRTFTALLLAYLLLALAFSRLSTFALSGFCFSSLFLLLLRVPDKAVRYQRAPLPL